MPVRRARHGRARRKNAPRTWAGLYTSHYYGTKKKKARAKGRRSNGAKTKLANPRKHRRVTTVVTKHRYRNPSLRRFYRRTTRRRNNPGFLSGDLAKVAGILGGATITNLIAKQVPAKYTTGTLGYATLTALAFGQGYVVKKFFKNQALGQDMMIGGLVLVAMKLMSDYFPSVSLPFSMNGLGVIGNSSFTVPQVPIPGSMGRFQIAPNYQTAINAAIPVVTAKTMNGINQSVTMGGRTGSRRLN